MQTARIVTAFVMLSYAAVGAAAHPVEAANAVHMPQGLRQLFQAEMRELLSGTQRIAAALPVANWEGIASSALAMRDSYIRDKKLTVAQGGDLDMLADQFKEPALHIWKYDSSMTQPAMFSGLAAVPLKPFCGTIGVAPGEIVVVRML
mgnify:CR=1 FL=1